MLLSIITPTYNRANKLRDVYLSLRDQSFQDFEWVIVDDGSIDNTKQVVFELIKNAKFKIKYTKICHGGKHFATRRAYEVAAGDWVFELDSDDTLYDETTLQKISTWISELKNTHCAIAGCFIDQHNNKMPELNNKCFVDYNREDYLDTFCNLDTWNLLNIPWVMKMEYARSVMPPKITDNLSYFPEAVINFRRVLNKDDFNLRVYNTPIYRYNMYNEDSVSVNTSKTNAMWWYHKSMILDLKKWHLSDKYQKFYKSHVHGLLNFPGKTLKDKWLVLYNAGDLNAFWRNLPSYILKTLFSVTNVDNKHQITFLGIRISV